MGKIVKIYCEGTSGSYDYDILEKVVTDFPSVKIEPIGSKFGAGATIKFLEGEGGRVIDKSDFYFFFRDRDFDRPIKKGESHLDFEEIKNSHQTTIGARCYSQRITIENYLFNVETFFTFLVEKDLGAKHGINTVEEARKLFIDAAISIKAYQAVRHTLGKMRKRIDFGTSWKESGTLPKNLDLDTCQSEALLLINNEKQKTDNWNEHGFETDLTTFLDIFDDAFFQNLDFLIWFQGKDFQAALQKILIGFSMKEYFRYAIKNFNYLLFPDLVELREMIKTHAGA